MKTEHFSLDHDTYDTEKSSLWVYMYLDKQLTTKEIPPLSIMCCLFSLSVDRTEKKLCMKYIAW